MYTKLTYKDNFEGSPIKNYRLFDACFFCTKKTKQKTRVYLTKPLNIPERVQNAEIRVIYFVFCDENCSNLYILDHL